MLKSANLISKLMDLFYLNFLFSLEFDRCVESDRFQIIVFACLSIGFSDFAGRKIAGTFSIEEIARMIVIIIHNLSGVLAVIVCFNEIFVTCTHIREGRSPRGLTDFLHAPCKESNIA